MLSKFFWQCSFVLMTPEMSTTTLLILDLGHKEYAKLQGKDIEQQ